MIPPLQVTGVGAGPADPARPAAEAPERRGTW